jgi:hypothetical protein
MRRLWPRTPGARFVVGAIAFFAVLNVISFIVSTARPEPSGKDGSAYATQPRGAAAYAELLRREGHRVNYLREPLEEARLDPDGTVVVLDADLESAERAALARFVSRGGRLVSAGENAGRGIVPRAPRWSQEGPRFARPIVPVPETSAVSRVQSSGAGGFSGLGGALPALGEEPALLAVAQSARGRALLLADSSPLQNRLLGRADNAALGLALAGAPDRTVTFVESVHGFGRATGLAALPSRWKFGLAIAVLAALVALLALGLRRAREPDVALAPVRAAARAQVIRTAALAPDASDDVVREAALRQGFEEDEIAALTGGDRDSALTGDVLSIGRALARGRR